MLLTFDGLGYRGEVHWAIFKRSFSLFIVLRPDSAFSLFVMQVPNFSFGIPDIHFKDCCLQKTLPATDLDKEKGPLTPLIVPLFFPLAVV